MDEQQRGHLRDDLTGFFRGDLLFDDLSRAVYSTDASIFEVRPAGIVRPRDEADVQALVRYAYANDLPLIARGAGTGLAGESLGRGLVLDFSKYFRDIVAVDGDTVRVQPGVTLADLNRRLEPLGRRFAPDPASAAVCTLGGMLANDASGARALKYGYTHDHVAALRVILDNGDAVELGREAVPQLDDENPSHLRDILLTLGVLLEQHSGLIATAGPRTPYNRCGYRLDHVLIEQRLDLPRLLVGSEGTLALFTEATLRTVPLPVGRSLVLLVFASLERALKALPHLLTTGPAACELMDRRLLSLARGNGMSRLATLVPTVAEAALLIEYETDTPLEARHRANELADRFYRREALALQAITASDPAEHEALWQLRTAALPTLYGVPNGPRPVPFIEDVGVPLDSLLEYLRRTQDILQEHETTALFLVHAATGQVHTRPFLDLHRPADVARLAGLAEQVHALAMRLGGTVSTQHGTGLARTPWVARQAGPLYPLYRQVKAIFDPKNLFNPGKIVDPDPEFSTWPLRRSGTAATEPSEGVLALRVESERCNGCGHCRTEQAPQRLCPIFRVTGDEEASPRAKVNLVRHLLTDGADMNALAPAEVRALAEGCVHCRMCALECPSRVDVCKLMLGVKAANVAEYGLDWPSWFFARMEAIARWGSALPLLTNFALGSRGVRWLLDKTVGLAPQRRLPRFAARSFLSRAKRRGWTRLPKGSDRPCVLYFVDLYANYVDPSIAEATVAVLHHNGFDVYIPAAQRGSGIEALHQGDAEAARETARHNLRLLAEPARGGMPILCSEPMAAVMLRSDYPDLVNDTDAATVALHTVELTSFLWNLHGKGRLRTDFQPLDFGIGHHVPCHIKALGSADGPSLLDLIPRLRVQTIDVSCSGMAGSFGLASRNDATSRQAGRPMTEALGQPQALFGATECSSCRLQMEDTAGKRTLHPAQYLALAYGLLPEVADRLREPIRTRRLQ